MSDIKKIRVGGVDYNISPDLTNYAKKSDLNSYVAKTELTSYAKKTDLTGYAKKTEINSLISEVQTKEYYYNDGSNEVVPIKHPDLSTQPSILPYKFMGKYVYEQLIPVNSLGAELDNMLILSSEAVGIGMVKPVSVTCSGGKLTPSSDISSYKWLKVIYTAMPEESLGYYYGGEEGLTLLDLSTSGSSNGYEYVDLGLPSGLKWAKCNIGASTAIDNGLYFAWGETVGYKDASSEKSFSWSDYKYGSDYNKLTKYCTSSSYGTVDNKTTLEPSDDAAFVNMGGSWRMPSEEEFEELLNNTTNTWTTVEGVPGRLFTGNNGNTLFFPASGYCYYGNVSYVDFYGFCWSSSLYSSYPFYAHCLYFYSDVRSVDYYYRCNGHAVRGVVS